MAKTATFRFNRNGDLVITTLQGTKHRFVCVSRGVNWCKENNVSAYFERN